MSTPTVFRTRNPQAVALALDYSAAVGEWKQRARALLEELGFPGRKPFVPGSMLHFRLAGIECAAGERPPRGWRVAESDDGHAFIPDRRTVAGRHAASKLTGAAPPRDPRLDLPGMPSRHWEGNHMLHPALQVLEGDTVLYVSWSEAPVSEIDLAIWEPVRLSEFYAAVEADDAAKEATDRA